MEKVIYLLVSTDFKMCFRSVARDVLSFPITRELFGLSVVEGWILVQCRVMCSL